METENKTLNRYFIEGVPVEEEGEQWVEASDATEAAGMARSLYGVFPWHFSRVEGTNPQTGKPEVLFLTEEGVLQNLASLPSAFLT